VYFLLVFVFYGRQPVRAEKVFDGTIEKENEGERIPSDHDIILGTRRCDGAVFENESCSS
jgi:hypothetical protein